MGKPTRRTRDTRYGVADPGLANILEWIAELGAAQATEQAPGMHSLFFSWCTG